MELIHEVEIKVGQTLIPRDAARSFLKDGPYTAVRDAEGRDDEGFPIWVVRGRSGKESPVSMGWFVDRNYHYLGQQRKP